MSNSTGKILELSCDDSPLSVTGSIIGILTLAYAILATIVFLTTSLAGASQEKRQFAARLEGEIKSLELLIELLRNSSHLVPNDNGVARRLDRRLDQATKIIQDVMRQVFGDVFEWESPHRRHFRSRARFLSEKENLSQHFDHIVSHRTQLEAVFQGLMASMVIAEVQKQTNLHSEMMRMHHRQEARIEQIMQALHLNTTEARPPDTDGGHEPADEMGAFGILNEVLRSPSPRDQPGRPGSAPGV